MKYIGARSDENIIELIATAKSVRILNQKEMSEYKSKFNPNYPHKHICIGDSHELILFMESGERITIVFLTQMEMARALALAMPKNPHYNQNKKQWF